jgi:replicative DNA helicase
MDVLDLDILTFLSDRSNYEKYGEVVDKGLCTKVSWRLVQDFGEYYENHPEVQQIDSDFTLWFRVDKHPGMKSDEAESYGAIINNIQSKKDDGFGVSDTFVDTLKMARTKATILHLTDDLDSGRINLSEFSTRVSALYEPIRAGDSGGPVILDLEELAKNGRDKNGVYWRLEDLNKSVGPIRKGDLVIVAKRPEVGGTSFLASELTFMFEQLGDKDAVIFNNEEAPDKIYTRVVSAALGVDYRTMMSNPVHYANEYTKFLDGRKIDIIHSTSMLASDIRRRLDSGNYGLLGVNVLLKVGVPGRMEDHDKLQYVGEELRSLASDYCPVIGITQADPSAEGVRYIHQDRIYKSKTALQGEADVLLMIGMDYDEPPDTRFIHVAKNKIPPAPCTDPSVSHIMSEIKFDGQLGRFSSKLFKGNSRAFK